MGGWRQGEARDAGLEGRRGWGRDRGRTAAAPAREVGTRQPKVAAAAARRMFPREEAGDGEARARDGAWGTGQGIRLRPWPQCHPTGKPVPPSQGKSSSRTTPCPRPCPAPSPAGGWGGWGPGRTCVLVVSWITAFRKFSLESADPIPLEPAPAGPRSRLPPRPGFGIQLQLRGPRCSLRSRAAHPARQPGAGPAPS